MWLLMRLDICVIVEVDVAVAVSVGFVVRI